MTWQIAFGDGDVSDSVCEECVRPFVPYQKDEEVDWHDVETDYYLPGRIVAVYEGKNGDNLYDVEVEDDDETAIVRGVTSSDLRRNVPVVLKVGTRVMAYFPGYDESYPGEIVGADEDEETYTIQFDDGDYREGVTLDEIQPLRNDE